jgi:lipid-binding SYLF domain-containing protein
MRKRIINTLICTGVLCLAGSGAAMADEMKGNTTGGEVTTGSGVSTGGGASGSKEVANAKDTVQEAAQVVQQLGSDPGTKDVLGQAKTVFIVPDYGRASLGVGGAGGQGVLVANQEGSWSAPAFYNIGAINAGLQAGVEAGPIAFLIISDKALEDFRNKNNFSLNADAGLTIVNFSRRGQLSAGKGADVIVWNGTKGLYGDLAVSVSDIFWDKEANQAYYQKKVDASDIIGGQVKDPMPSSPLESEFSALESGSPRGNTPGTQQEENYKDQEQQY